MNSIQSICKSIKSSSRCRMLLSHLVEYGNGTRGYTIATWGTFPQLVRDWYVNDILAYRGGRADLLVAKLLEYCEKNK